MTGPDATEPSWREVRAALEHTLDLPHDQRSAYLNGVKADRPRLAARLRDLLSNATSTRLTPDQPLDSLARELAAAPLPREGERLGRFTVERLLGTGGMGVVYAARDPELSRTVAVKVIHAALVSPDYLRRFEREAHALARLRHPGIAQVYETGSLERGKGAGHSSPYIVMEFIPEARPLDAHGLTFTPLIERFQSVLAAVQHAHEHGVIHCDLKPANILLDRSGKPKLIDFGIARLGTSMDTATGGTAGTLRYMSPERCGGVGVVSGESGLGETRTDVFALGVILYELLEGRSPYACVDGSPGVLMDAVRAGKIVPPRLAAAPPEMKRDLGAILARALAFEPTERYSSVAAFSEDLRRLLAHEPVAARSPSLLHEVRLMARRNRLVVSAVLLMVAALGLGVVLATIGLVHARRARGEAEAEVLRSRRVIRFLEGTIGSVIPETQSEATPIPGYGTDRITRWLHEGARFESQRTGEGARVADVLLQAAEQVGPQFADDPLLEAQLAVDLSQSLHALKQYEMSVALARRARELRLAHLGPDHEDTLKALVILALYATQDPSQTDLIREALRGVESRFGRRDPRWFQLRAFLVDTLADRVSDQAAVEECDAAIRECASEPADPARLASLEYRRGLYQAGVEGKEAQGRAAAERALAEIVRLDGGPTLANLYQRFRLGMLYLEHDAGRAEALLRECLELAPTFEGPQTIFCYEVRSRLYEALLRQHKLGPAEAVAREQLANAVTAIEYAPYYTVKARARVARVVTWSASLGEHKDLDEAEQLAREAAVDGLRYDEQSPGGNFDAYFRAIWAQALLLRGDPGSLRTAEQLIRSTMEARAAAPVTPWCDGYLALTQAQLCRAQGRGSESDAAFDRAATLLDQFKDRNHPLVLTFQDALPIR